MPESVASHCGCHKITMQRLRIRDQCPAEARQPGEVPILVQHLGLETPQPRGESDASILYLFQTDEPEGRILGKSLGVVEIFVASQATIDRLP